MVPHPNDGDTDCSLLEREPDSIDLEEEEDFSANSADLPEEVITRLQ